MVVAGLMLVALYGWIRTASHHERAGSRLDSVHKGRAVEPLERPGTSGSIWLKPLQAEHPIGPNQPRLLNRCSV
jgi:hypothetical protein